MYAKVWFGGKQCLDPVALRRSCLEASPAIPVDWFGKANIFNDRSGPNPGTGGIILLRRDLLALDVNDVHDLEMVDHFGQKVVFKNLHIAGPTVCLNPSSPENENTAHFVPLADNRRRWRMTSVNRGYNLRVTPNGNYATSTATSATVPFTWAEVIESLWGYLPAAKAGTVPTLPSEPDGSPDNFAYWGESAIEAIGHFTARCGVSLCRDPFTDEYSFAEMGADQAGLEREFRKLDKTVRIWDIEPINPAIGSVPDQIDVYFRKSPGPRSYAQSPYFVVSIAAVARSDGGPTDGEGGTLVIHDDLLAKYISRELQNEAELILRANDRASAFWQSRRDWFNSPLRRTYSGLVDTIATGSQVEAISWGDTGYGMRTVVELRPARDPIADWPGNEHQPWTDDEWVVIVAEESGSGDGDAVPTGYYAGRVTQPNVAASDWDPLFECFWKGANGEVPVVGHRYRSSFEGYLENADGKLRPVYVGGCCEGTETIEPDEDWAGDRTVDCPDIETVECNEDCTDVGDPNFGDCPDSSTVPRTPHPVCGNCNCFSEYSTLLTNIIVTIGHPLCSPEKSMEYNAAGSAGAGWYTSITFNVPCGDYGWSCDDNSTLYLFYGDAGGGCGLYTSTDGVAWDGPEPPDTLNCDDISTPGYCRMVFTISFGILGYFNCGFADSALLYINAFP